MTSRPNYALRNRDVSSDNDSYHSEDDTLAHQATSTPTLLLRKNEFFVDEILDSVYNRKKMKFQFYIKWDGYGECENTWEDEPNVPKWVINEYFSNRQTECTNLVLEMQEEVERMRLQLSQRDKIFEKLLLFAKKCKHESSGYILDSVKEILCGLDVKTFESINPDKYDIIKMNFDKNAVGDANSTFTVLKTNRYESSKVEWDWDRTFKTCPTVLMSFLKERIEQNDEKSKFEVVKPNSRLTKSTIQDSVALNDAHDTYQLPYAEECVDLQIDDIPQELDFLNRDTTMDTIMDLPSIESNLYKDNAIKIPSNSTKSACESFITKKVKYVDTPKSLDKERFLAQNSNSNIIDDNRVLANRTSSHVITKNGKSAGKSTGKSTKATGKSIKATGKSKSTGKSIKATNKSTKAASKSAGKATGRVIKDTDKAKGRLIKDTTKAIAKTARLKTIDRPPKAIGKAIGKSVATKSTGKSRPKIIPSKSIKTTGNSSKPNTNTITPKSSKILHHPKPIPSIKSSTKSKKSISSSKFSKLLPSPPHSASSSISILQKSCLDIDLKPNTFSILPKKLSDFDVAKRLLKDRKLNLTHHPINTLYKLPPTLKLFGKERIKYKLQPFSRGQ